MGETISTVIPASEIENLINNIIGAVTVSPINLSMSDGTMISSADGEILIALKKEHRPSADYVRTLRRTLFEAYPETTFFFLEPGDISTQVLNFRHFGANRRAGDRPAWQRRAEPEDRAGLATLDPKRIPGAVDVRLHQVTDTPELLVDVDRESASRLGLTQRDVANDLLVSLSSSGQTAPSFWLDPKKGIQYTVAVQTPQANMDSMAALEATPIGTSGGQPQLLTNLAQFSRSVGATNITHFNAMPTYDVLASVDGTDLGTMALGLRQAIAQFDGKLPRGTAIKLKGQIESMETSFTGLGYGLIFAILLVYLLMVVNFQSWLDPFVILMALPGAISGIAWILFLSNTTLSVPALMGSIMCVGVATANSILVVTFANDHRRSTSDPSERDAARAALVAGSTRLRPVLMTALAMMIGMLPMSLGIGEGAEQNAPLGARGDRWPALGQRLHVVLRARDVQRAAPKKFPLASATELEQAS